MTTADVYMQSLEPEVRMAVNLILDELQGNRPSEPETRRPPGGQPEPSRYQVRAWKRCLILVRRTISFFAVWA